MKRRLKLKTKNAVLFLSLLLIIGLTGYFLITKIAYMIRFNKIDTMLNANLKIIKEKNDTYNTKFLEKRKELSDKLSEMSDIESKVKEDLKSSYIVGVGDSILLSVTDDLYRMFPAGHFDGKISRTLKEGIGILSDLKKQGKLGDILVLTLANNGYFSESTCRELMNVVEERTIYWINSVGPDDPNFNARFKEFAKKYPNIHIVDWQETSKGHSDYFYADGTHLKPSGITAYSNMIYNTLYNKYLKEYKKEKEVMQDEYENGNKNLISFYGGDLLISASVKISDRYYGSIINTKKNYKFKSLFKDIKSKKENNLLEKRIVFMFDKNDNISLKQYNKLIELCDGYQIYICDISGKELKFNNKNVKVIDFNDELKMNEDYYMFDKVHLSDTGIKALVNKIYDSTENIDY